jgi:hypothetical protein
MDRLIIHDKFNIIGNYNSNFRKENMSSWIKELFQNKQSGYSNDLIHQYLYSYLFLNNNNNVEDIINIIDKAIGIEINFRVKNILPKIRKNNFSLSDFKYLVDSILETIRKINDTVFIINKYRNKYFNTIEYKKYYWGMSIIYKVALNNIFSKLIDHSIIKKYLESNMIEKEDENKNDIKNIFYFMYKIKNYNPQCFEYFINNFVNNVDAHMNEDEYISNSVNLGIFALFKNFNSKMKTFKEFDEYYSFIDKETKKNLTIKLTNNLVSVLSNIFSYNISKNEIKIVMNFCHKNLENIKRVWSNLNESDSIYEKELFINTIMNFINSKFELLVPDCKTFDGFNNFIHFFDRAITLDKIINKDSDNLTHLSEKLSNNLQNVIASDKKFIDIMCQIINKKMIEISVMNNNPENSASICNILQLLNYVNEKDVFYAKYSQYLIGRLLSSPNLYFEKQIVDTIESIQDYSYVKKLHKMIDDIGISESNLNNYKLIKINQKENTVDSNFSLDKLDLITFSYNVWDISLNKNKKQITDFSNFVENSQLKSYLLTYEKFYKTKYSGRSLSWFLEMGSIQVGTVCNKNEYTLLLNLYQMALLELFNQKDSISEEDVIDYMTKCFGKNLDTYQNVIKSFLISGILMKTAKLEYNSNFTNSTSLVNLIQIYNNVSSYEIKIDKQIESQITLDREIVIQANIINLLKIQKMNLDGIYHKLSDTLCKYFTVDKNIVKENLDILTKKEYITSNSDEYSNIVY